MHGCPCAYNKCIVRLCMLSISLLSRVTVYACRYLPQLRSCSGWEWYLTWTTLADSKLPRWRWIWWYCKIKIVCTMAHAWVIFLQEFLMFDASFVVSCTLSLPTGAALAAVLCTSNTRDVEEVDVIGCTVDESPSEGVSCKCIVSKHVYHKHVVAMCITWCYYILLSLISQYT